MNIVIRVDSSNDIGGGHIIRCLTLAGELAKYNYNITFACLPLNGNFIPLIIKRGYKVVELPKGHKKFLAKNSYESNLTRSELEDAELFLSLIHEADLVITDHYAIGAKWQKKIRDALNCKIMAIDDLLRKHDADIILDQTYGRLDTDYFANYRVLSGTKYALLDSRFSYYREKYSKEKFTCDKNKILISMGGIDSQSITIAVIKEVIKFHKFSDYEYTVVLSENSSGFDLVKSICSKYENINLIEFVDDMAKVMSEHCIAIGAPGATSWERACLGLPSIVIPLAENQLQVCAQLIKLNAAIKVSRDSLSHMLNDAIQMVLANYNQFVSNNISICDGKGVHRVVTSIRDLFKLELAECRLFKAEFSDAKIIYDWQCNPISRKYFNNPNIPTWEEHVEWVNKQITNQDIDLYIVKCSFKNIPLGFVKIDKNNIVSILVSPDYHGLGIGEKAVNILSQMFPNREFIAEVDPKNISSLKMFNKCGFVNIEGSDRIYKRKVRE